MSAPEANPKITDDHLRRIAAVYVRQSTYVQLQNNTASTARQYNMANVARRYGWADSRVNVIDKDQGLSGATIDRREGFQEMMAEIILGRIGAVFAVEASRLARDSADWQQLVKLCMHTNTLIIDDKTVSFYTSLFNVNFRHIRYKSPLPLNEYPNEGLLTMPQPPAGNTYSCGAGSTPSSFRSPLP